MLGQANFHLEELEKETYKEREVWGITLSFPRYVDQSRSFSGIGMDPLQYKRFLIDPDTGDFLAMKVREFAFR